MRKIFLLSYLFDSNVQKYNHNLTALWNWLHYYLPAKPVQYLCSSLCMFFIMYSVIPVIKYREVFGTAPVHSKDLYCVEHLVTVRNNSCGKVMFSQASGRHPPWHAPTQADHPPGDDHCSGWYASFWNAFLFHRHLVRALVWPAVKSWRFAWYKGQILAYLQGVLNTFESSHNMYYSPFYQFYLYYLLA